MGGIGRDVELALGGCGEGGECTYVCISQAVCVRFAFLYVYLSVTGSEFVALYSDVGPSLKCVHGHKVETSVWRTARGQVVLYTRMLLFLLQKLRGHLREQSRWIFQN